MVDAATSIEQAKRFWNGFGAGDFSAWESVLAPDLLRIGPRDGDESDIIHGKDAYLKFMADVKKTMPAEHSVETHEIVASPDGRKVFVHCTEKNIGVGAAGSTEKMDAKVVLILHINDDNLISVVDIYWKQPAFDIEWTEYEKLTQAADEG